jgi:hypothetical protein
MENGKQHVNRIEFSSTDSEIRVQCRIQSGSLTFESTVLISSQWINPLFMYFQKTNPEKQIDEQLERILFPDGSTFYSLNTEELSNNSIDWNEFLGFEKEPRKIRA